MDGWKERGSDGMLLTLNTEALRRPQVEIISCKRSQGKQDWPGYHSRLKWYSSRWELQAHCLGFPVPGGRWDCEGLSEDKATLWAGKGPPIASEDMELSKYSQDSSRTKNVLFQWNQTHPQTREHWLYKLISLPMHTPDSKHSSILGWK